MEIDKTMVLGDPACIHFVSTWLVMKDVCAMSATCKAMRRAIQHSPIWMNLLGESDSFRATLEEPSPCVDVGTPLELLLRSFRHIGVVVMLTTEPVKNHRYIVPKQTYLIKANRKLTVRRFWKRVFEKGSAFPWKSTSLSQVEIDGCKTMEEVMRFRIDDSLVLNKDPDQEKHCWAVQITYLPTWPLEKIECSVRFMKPSAYEAYLKKNPPIQQNASFRSSLHRNEMFYMDAITKITPPEKRT
jgi:hypothetical protein